MGPGLAQRVMEVRKKRLIKEKRWYQTQRDMLNKQIFDLDRVIFAWDGIKEAQQIASCLKSANIELKGMMKILQDDQEDLMGGAV
ncbi:vacuolar protein sorting-associated protein 60.1 [Lactuca sativa]|uniref:vacuolar protein sorting-associated protein 60.1 n=1 Tax=Lactuca sativa TaxID=4236 RepID=UPI001C68F649|nr:vacuolar protein sorting-associated protein 60.1 [Lactuca sativa]XP_042754202.1 vacuolar protein sorting-associated protein 60.1 [Lactuca sativa]